MRQFFFLSLVPVRVSGATDPALHRGNFFLPDLMELTLTSETDLTLDLGNYGDIIQVARGKWL